MFLQDNLSQVVKHSVVYTFAFSQPFSFYVDAYPIMQNEILEQSSVLKYGMQHESIRVLQHKLHKLSYYDSSLNGDFDVLTEYALKKFQEEHELEQHGQADKATIERILDKEKESYLDYLNDHPLDFTVGDNGEEVVELQEALFYLGYYTDSLDGIFGPRTEGALRAYKQDRGLESKHIEKEPVTLSATTTQAVSTTSERSNMIKSQAPENNQSQKSTQIEHISSNRQSLIGKAKFYIGVPYQWGGATPSGFDCSGYLQFVFQELNISLPRTVSDIWNATIPINSPSIGDLVFFETYKPGPSHAGIYLGNGQFIHAGLSNGVEISQLSQDYWSKRYIGAKRVNLH
ncbi:NlpC/P60 family protein [Gracilibacillus sp. YIM 98692]|uniref:C40 family peptidase n=1 Tax=Gracilibacillus sp. YIM 98692 TaxID=2663532 RepID=UPI0013D86F6E|nr:NlpC/P60 family protein [Gracilibacillus sp. YIM 98692]